MDIDTLPQETQALVATALQSFQVDTTFNIYPNQRLAIIRSLGPFFFESNEDWDTQVDFKHIPVLTFADKVRARIAEIAAEKVIPLWRIAIQETETLYEYDEEAIRAEQVKEHIYESQKTRFPIEHISVFDVPRISRAEHIMEMTRCAWSRIIADEVLFLQQANEWWSIYPGAGGSIREIAIKWAAQESLYAITGLSAYHQDLPNEATQDEEDIFRSIIDGPSGYAALAFADPNIANGYSISKEKLRSFWLWWLNEGIVQAWSEEKIKNY